MNRTAMKQKELDLKNKEMELQDKMNKRTTRRNLISKFIPSFKLQDAEWYKKVQGGTFKPGSLIKTFYQGLPSEWNKQICVPSATLSIPCGDMRIAIVNYVNSIGTQHIDDLSQSDIAYSLSALYGQSLKNNSRVPEEEPPEYGIYLLAQIDAMCLAERMKVALDVATKYVDQNRAYGRRLVEAIGFNFDDIRANRSNYIGRLNNIIKEINISFAVPKGLGYYSRKMYLANTILRDMKAEAGALTLFRQVYYWTFNETSNALDTVVFGAAGGTPHTMSEIFVQLDGMITQIKESVVCNNIKANLLSAIPSGNFEQMSSYTEELKDIFSDTDEAREQLANLSTLPDFATIDQATCGVKVSSQGYIYQGAENIPGLKLDLRRGIAGNAATVTDVFNRANTLLNFYHEDISDDDILTSTRFKQTYRHVSGKVYVDSCGMEVVSNITIMDGGKEYLQLVECSTQVMTELDPAAASRLHQASQYKSLMLTQFDWSPLVYIHPFGKSAGSSNSDPSYVTTATEGTLDIYNYVTFGDVGKCVHYPVESIKILNTACNKSLFVLDDSIFNRSF